MTRFQKSRALLGSLFFIIITISQQACGPDLPDEVARAYEELPKKLDFNIHVKPILSDKCFACHGPDKVKIEAGLQLHASQTAFAELPENEGKYAIVPGSLQKSEVFHRIISEDEELIMPPKDANLKLAPKEKAVLIRWIEEGAEYKPHWSFVKPEKPEVPEVKEKEKMANPIDNFVLARLESEGLDLSPPADKSVLLRRLSLDLTGLPPTPAEIKAFMDDESANAYEKQVDRLLASPHYGEKMATDWMDLARYADTYGYQVDRYRDMSPWRDWVIKSFNKNMPYDEFASWQIAGDLMPNPTREQMIATGFNRLHPQNMEGGIVDEEFRVEYVADRTNVVGQGLLALTLGCAKCHDHKYDPISQKNYFELYSFFNNQNETGQISWDPKDIPVPNMLLPTEEEEKIIAFLEEQEQKQLRKTDSLKNELVPDFEKWLSQRSYKNIGPGIPYNGLQAKFDFNKNLKNTVRSSHSGRMDRQFSNDEMPEFGEGKYGQALKLNGDAWMDADPIGIFKRNDPFSIGLWVKVPENLKEGVIFHKNQGTRLHSYKGYHLNIRDNKLEAMLAHTWPDNAIVKVSEQDMPKGEWTHLMVTYDGSSKAGGLQIYMNGNLLTCKTEVDNLYKDIVFNQLEDQIYKDPIEPALQLGARWRGKGIGGAFADELLVYNRELSALEVMMVARNEQLIQIAKQSTAQLKQHEKELLKEYYFSSQATQYQAEIKKLSQIRAALVDSVEKVQEVMIMKEMDSPRQAYILERGVYDAHGEEVFPNTPEHIFAWKDKYPKNRLGLAQWLFDEDHPLTARVAVNRYWQNYFGRGIVRTTEDFGNQGELPSHPELLDWLTVTFKESGWDVKALQKLIVMSNTYRQTSVTPAELREKDPHNVLLARGPKGRLSSEMLRDNALLASGLLNDSVGGKSVKPYQPEGLWTMNADTYVQDHGDDLYSRSLYVYWKRTVPLPTLATFDLPERVECAVRRQKTNTPLQALVLLNDPAYLETARVLGAIICRSEEPAQGITEAYQRLTGKTPPQDELDLLLDLQEKEYQKFTEHPEKIKGWVEAGEYQLSDSLDLKMLAANAVVASVILNSDATITKR